MTTERAASDHASQEVPRELVLPTPCSCSLVPDVTTPLYSSPVSRALRQALRGHAVANFLERRTCEVWRIALPGTWVNRAKEKGRGVVAASARSFLPMSYAKRAQTSIILPLPVA